MKPFILTLTIRISYNSYAAQTSATGKRCKLVLLGITWRGKEILGNHNKILGNPGDVNEILENLLASCPHTPLLALP